MVVVVSACVHFLPQEGLVFAKFPALFEKQTFLMMVAGYVDVGVVTQRKKREVVLMVQLDLEILVIFVTEIPILEIMREEQICIILITETDPIEKVEEERNPGMIIAKDLEENLERDHDVLKVTTLSPNYTVQVQVSNQFSSKTYSPSASHLQLSTNFYSSSLFFAAFNDTYVSPLRFLLLLFSIPLLHCYSSCAWLSSIS